MYDKICKICGKPFLAANPRYNICSEECRRENRRQYDKYKNHRYYRTEKATAKRKVYYKEHYKPTVHYCQVCGDPLPDGRQTYCLRCLVSTYMTAEQPYKQIAYNRLALRGYDKAMILDEAERMNIR